MTGRKPPSRLEPYVIDVGAGGLPSGKGRVSSSPAQLDGLAKAMAAQHDAWAHESGDVTRHIVYYAHGGLVDEGKGVSVAERMIGWWLQNRIYPIHILWESGALETILEYLKRRLEEFVTPEGISEDIEDLIDARIEEIGRSVRPVWEEMKTKGRLASAPLSGKPIDWTSQEPGSEPGVSLFVDRLTAYVARHAGSVRVHLVGHSAGAVVLAALVRRLLAAGIAIESMQLMGGAIRAEEFVRDVVPELASAPGGSGKIRRFVAYDLTEKCEQGDTFPRPPIGIYHKSLLYLVARSLEYSSDDAEVPMLGLSKDLTTPWTMPDGSSRQLVDLIGGSGNAVICPNTASQADQRSGAHRHEGFHSDPDTMTAVLLRIMDRHDIGRLTPYPPGGMPSHGS
ncbi:MAG: alpha/beta hydrolase [Candidatus Limnocylindrales bacterium]